MGTAISRWVFFLFYCGRSWPLQINLRRFDALYSFILTAVCFGTGEKLAGR